MMNIYFLVGLLTVVHVKDSSACRLRWRLRARAVFQEIFNLEQDRIVPFNENENTQKQRPTTMESTVVNQPAPHDGGFPFFKPFEIYTDQGGCYEEGHAKEYKGRIDHTESGLSCANWSVFTYWLYQRLKAAKMRKDQRVLESIWNMSWHDSARDDAEIFAANQTILDARHKGLFDHNYCRDPDNSGRPWCFVETKSYLVWQACPVPKCTQCWRMRQRAVKFLFIPPLLQTTWIPNCKMDGSFDGLQCWKSYCWCSDRKGNLITGTLTEKTKGTPICTHEHTRPGAKRMRVRRTDKSQPKSKRLPNKDTYRKLGHKTHKSKRKVVQKLKKSIPILDTTHSILRMFQRTLNRQAKKPETTKPRGGCKALPDKETVENVTIVTHDRKRKYTCQVRYAVVDTLRCEQVPRSRKNNKKLSATTSPLQRCFVVQRRRVIGWACTRDIDESSWYVVRFSRVPVTSRKVGKASKAIFQGVSYVCFGSPGMGLKGHGSNKACPCRRSSLTFTTIYIKEVGKERFMCFKSWRHWKLVKSTCVKMDAKISDND